MSNPADDGPNLEIRLEKVCYIIIKAREFDVKEAGEEDEASSAADDNERAILLDYPSDPTYLELRSFMETLNRDEFVDLLALVWIGRGDYAANEWNDVVGEARRIVDKKAPDYLLGIPLLSDFLEEGLSALGFSCEDFERGHL